MNHSRRTVYAVLIPALLLVAPIAHAVVVTPPEPTQGTYTEEHVTLSASPTSVVTGQAVLLTWSSTVTSNGNPTSLQPSWCSGNFNMGGNSTYDASTDTTYAGGPVSGSVYVYPSASKTYTVTCMTVSTAGYDSPGSASVSVTATAGLNISCSAAPTTATTGQTVTWTGNASGGTGPYTYKWGGDDGLTGLTGRVVSLSYSAVGIKNGVLQVTDSSGGTSTGYSTRYNNGNGVDAGGYTCNGPLVPGYGTAYTEDYPVLNAGSTHDNGGPGFYLQGADGYNAPPDYPGNTNYCVSVTMRQQACGTVQNPSRANCEPRTSINIQWHSGTGVSSVGTEQSDQWHGTESFVSGSSVTPPKTETVACSNSVTVGPSCASNTGASCTSSPNSCGQTGTGTIQCDGSCSATTPPDSSCTAPDLTAGAISPTAATAGTGTNFRAIITNGGNASTGGSFPNLFQTATSYNASTDSASGVSDIGSQNSGTLGVGFLSNLPQRYTFPSAGTYYMRACADKASAGDAGSIAESNENNNCGPWTAIIVSGAPVPSCTLSGSGSGATLTLSWTSTNATSGSIDHSVGATSPIASGSKNTTYPDADTTYTMSVQDASGNTGSCTAVVRGGNPICEPSATQSCTTCGSGCCGSGCGASPSISCSRSPSGASLAAPVTITYTAIPSVSPAATSPYTFRNALSQILQATSATTYQQTYVTAGSYAVTVGASNVSPAVACGSAVTITGSGCSNPNLSIGASPARVAKNSSSLISWSATGVSSSCSITENGSSLQTVNVPQNSCGIPNGSTTRTISAQTTYCITCDGNSAGKKCVIVNVLPGFQEF